MHLNSAGLFTVISTISRDKYNLRSYINIYLFVYLFLFRALSNQLRPRLIPKNHTHTHARTYPIGLLLTSDQTVLEAASNVTYSKP